MKEFLIIAFLFLITGGCKNEKEELLLGKWKSVKTYTSLYGYKLINEQNQRIEEYTINNKKITFDKAINWIDTCDYTATNSTINLSGIEINGETWSLSFYYWFVHDSLKIRPFDTFEFYTDIYYVRTNQ